jgi:carbamoyl-phosphate synthase / aspartate carbamoyltransferase / dihydroorotase
VTEKEGENPPPGFPGLETILPLLLNAVNDGRLTLEDIISKFHRNPRKIFNLPEQPNTYIEVDIDEEWTIPHANKHSKSKWTPFGGMRVRGCVHRVVLRGEVVYVDGRVLAPAGFGQNVRDWPLHKKSIFQQANERQVVNIMETGYKLDIFKPSDQWDTDRQTNDVFSKLLSESIPKLNVHFADRSPVSPIPPRSRCNSTSQRNEFTGNLHSKEAQNPSMFVLTAAKSLVGKHIATVDMFTKENLNDIFNLAQILKARVIKDRPLDDLLKGKIMASIFYEVSTRTSCSFAAAMQRLGGRVIYMNETTCLFKRVRAWKTPSQHFKCIRMY